MPHYRDHADDMAANRLNWDERVRIHVASDFYNVAAFRAGATTLLPVEVEEVGEVLGKTLLHLQCHFGLDTLSWAREGALVTGVDFSGAAITTAQTLAQELKIDARFIESNVYDLREALTGTFDVVFASYGVLVWLPDLPEWGRIMASFVRPGGFLYIIDGHPFFHMFADSPSGKDLRLVNRYFTSEALSYEEDGTYADPNAKLEHKRQHEFQHTLGEIVTSLVDAGLQIEFLHEFPFSAYAALPDMEKGDDGYYRLRQHDGLVPFLFSLKARKKPA